MHDLVIRNGLVVDGTGSPARVADVAVDGDRIVAVGTGDDVGPGRREVDADGRLVTPGWVDIHTHYDGQATWDPEVSPSGWHGVTTVVMGNCGVGFAPADPDRHDWLVQLMEGVEDIPGTALDEGMTWNWRTFPEYLDELDRLPRVLDVAAQVPHGAVRAFVMGDRGANNEPANADDIAAMAAIVREGIDAGAVGFTTTRTILHRAKDGTLAAGTTAAADEMIGIGEALGAAGAGVFETTSDMVDAEAEFAWMAEVSKRTGRPVTFSCLQNDIWPDQWRQLLQLSAAANADGAWIVPQVAGRPLCMLFGFDTTVHPFMGSAAYREIAELPLDERLARLSDPAVREAIVADASRSQWAKTFPVADPPDYEPPPDASIEAIARREGRTPEEVGFDLMMADGGRGLLYYPFLGYHELDFDVLHEMLRDDSTVLGLGDGGAHCGMICDASLPTYMLSHWVRDRTRGERLTLEDAVHHQTQRTARLYGFEDRGVVAPGYLADLNVIDFDEINLITPELVYDLPAGGRRLVQRAHGYVATVKSGAVTYADGVATGERPGRLVRGAQPAPA
jgi:N-acyl-D-aspartate/D-glutamate deacylase